MTSSVDFDAMTPPHLQDMFINSTDILMPSKGESTTSNIDQTIPPEWNDRPPLFQNLYLENKRRSGGPGGWLNRLAGNNTKNKRYNPEAENPNLLKGMIRKGIPPPLRCAVWMSNIIQSCYPHQDLQISHEYRTLAKVQILDHGYESIWSSSSSSPSNNNNNNNGSSTTTSGDHQQKMKKSDVQRLDFGNTSLFERLPPEANVRLLEEILWGLNQVILLDYAPVLPTLASILMRYMSESYVFCSIREISNNASGYYFPTSPGENFAYKRAFMDVLDKLHPSTSHALIANGCADQYTKAIFEDLFQPLFKDEYVFRIVDMYTLEGMKVLFRFGVALLVLYHRYVKEQTKRMNELINCNSGHSTASSNGNNNHVAAAGAAMSLSPASSEHENDDDDANHKPANGDNRGTPNSPTAIQQKDGSDDKVMDNDGNKQQKDGNDKACGTVDEEATQKKCEDANVEDIDWWEGLILFCSNGLNFEILVKKAYGVHGKGVRKRYRFPRRPILQRIIQMEEERYWQMGEGGRSNHNNSSFDEQQSSTGGGQGGASAEENDGGVYLTDSSISNHGDNAYQPKPIIQPVGLVPAKQPEDPLRQEPVIPKLAESSYVRTKLAEWLPLSLRFTKLDLIYSTNYHGRTLEQFYHHVHNAKHTITLLEPLLPITSSQEQQNDEGNTPNLIVGMYASQTWHASTKVYGDGNCSLFRLILPHDTNNDNNGIGGNDEKKNNYDKQEKGQDESQCWKWHPKQLLEEIPHEEDDDGTSLVTATAPPPSLWDSTPTTPSNNKANNQTALLEQFQVGTHEFISMGGNSDGSAGLRLNEDLTKAESAAADGFDNIPLAGKQFEVGLVEVYQIVRQIDGVGIRS